MKNALLTVALLLVFFVPEQAAAQEDSLFMESSSPLSIDLTLDSCFKALDFTEVTTGLLINKALPTINVALYNGTLTDSNVANMFAWRRAYGTLRRAFIDSTAAYDTLGAVTATMETYLENRVVPIALLNYQYNSLKDNAFGDSLIYLNTGEIQLHDVSGRTQSPYETRTCFISSAAVMQADTEVVRFVLPSALYITNDSRTIDYVEVDFDNGNGYITVDFDDVISVAYDTSVEAQVKVRIHFTDFSLLASQFLVKIEPNVFAAYGYPGHADAHYYVVSSGTYAGVRGKAHVYVHYSCQNATPKKIMRPLIIVSGYLGPKEVGSNYLSKAYATGRDYVSNIKVLDPVIHNKIISMEYDVIHISFEDAADYIQRNALVVEDIINEVNEEKISHGSTAKNVIIGYSMGGVVARLALGKIHAAHLASPSTVPDHDARVFYSHDAPQWGVNIPLGYQALTKSLFKFYGEKTGKVPFIEVMDVAWDYRALTCNAGQQMLINNIFTNNLHKNLYDTLQLFAEVSSLGCKAVFIADGSGNTNDSVFWQGGYFGSPVAWGDLTSGALMAYGHTNYAPYGPNNYFAHGFNIFATPKNDPLVSKQVFNGYIAMFLKNSQVFFYTTVSMAKHYQWNELDSKPGSIAKPSKGTLVNRNVYQTFSRYITTVFKSHCFVPSISGIAIQPESLNSDFDTRINTNCPTCTTLLKRHVTTDKGLLMDRALRNKEHSQYTPRSVQSFRFDFVNMAPALIKDDSVYNYAMPVSDRIPTCSVATGGLLGVNTYHEAGYNHDGENNNYPPTNSLYRVETLQYDECEAQPSTITVAGDLQLGDNTDNLSGELVIRNGSKLVLKTGANVRLYNNSKLIIEDGAELEIEDGVTTLLLDGDNSEIIIKGIFTTHNNVDFTFSGSGNVVFNCPSGAYCTTNFGTNNTINLTGNSRADKVLVVTGKGLDLTNLEELNITTAKVELGTNSEVVIGGSLELNAVRVSKTTGTAGNHIHKGFEINSPTGKTIAIDNCIFEYGIKGLTKSASSSLTQLVVENTTFTNCSLGLKTNECRCNLVNVRFDNCVTGWKAEAMSGSSDFRGYVQSVDNGIDYEGGSTAHLFIYESTFKTCNNSNTAQAILVDGEFNTTISCTHFEDNDNDIKKIDGVLNLSGSEYSENRFASSPEVGGSCYFNNTLYNTIDLSNVDFYIYDGNNDFDYPDETPNEVFNGTITSNTTTLALGGNHWKFSNFSPTDDLPGGLFNITSITATSPYSTATKLSSPSNCLSAWNGVQEYVERIHKPGKSALNKEISSYTIYPNPAANQLFIKVFNGSFSANQRVKAIDMMGRTLTLYALSHDSTTQSYDISQLAVGMYQIIVEKNGHILHKQKLVVSR